MTNVEENVGCGSVPGYAGRRPGAHAPSASSRPSAGAAAEPALLNLAAPTPAGRKLGAKRKPAAQLGLHVNSRLHVRGLIHMYYI